MDRRTADLFLSRHKRLADALVSGGWEPRFDPPDESLDYRRGDTWVRLFPDGRAEPFSRVRVPRGHITPVCRNYGDEGQFIDEVILSPL